MIFIWHEANIAHIGRHGVEPSEAEEAVLDARPPYPLKHEEDKHLVWGTTETGRHLQVIFVYPEDDEVDWAALDMAARAGLEEGEDAILVIHARDLTPREKRQWRRNQK